MEKKLRWKDKLIGSDCYFYEGDTEAGVLTNKLLWGKAEGDLYGKKYEFHTKGVLKYKTYIHDSESGKVIGEIDYAAWSFKAAVNIYGKGSFEWKYTDSLGKKWELSENDEPVIRYDGSYTKGEIYYANADELLLLTGYFVNRFYSDFITIIVLVVTVTVIIT